MEDVISEYTDVTKTLELYKANQEEACGFFQEWAKDESTALEEFAGDLLRIRKEESEALDGLLLQHQVFVSALRDILHKQKNLDLLLKRQRDAQAALSKAYKKNEKAKAGKKYEVKKDELVADIEAKSAEVKDVASAIDRMKLVVKMAEHSI